MISRKLLLIPLGILLLLQSGCWSKVEVENLAIVSAVGIDRIETEDGSKWQITLEVYLPKAMAAASGEEGGGRGGGQSATWITSSVGNTLQEAANNLSSRTPRILFYAHTHCVIIGKETAQKEKLTDILPIFFGFKEFRLRNHVLISEKSAFETLSSVWELEDSLADEIKDLTDETSLRLSKAVVADLKEVADALVSSGRDVIASKLEVFETPEPVSSGEQEKQGQQNQEAQSVRLHGSAVFSGDKLAGFFDDHETRGYLFAKGDVKVTVIPLQLDTDSVFECSVRILRSTSKTSMKMQKGQPQIELKIKTEGHIEELCPGDYDVDTAFLEKIGREISHEIEKEVMASVEKAKSLKADVFGFGQSIYRKDPKYWHQIAENWRDHFPELPVKVEVETIIRRTGAVSKPFKSS
ncbi:MAG: Ger(x)C family spore germination protein [Bacillota bacterium]